MYIVHYILIVFIYYYIYYIFLLINKIIFFNWKVHPKQSKNKPTPPPISQKRPTVASHVHTGPKQRKGFKVVSKPYPVKKKGKNREKTKIFF